MQHLAADKSYNNLNMSVEEALEKRKKASNTDLLSIHTRIIHHLLLVTLASFARTHSKPAQSSSESSYCEG